MRSEYRSEGLEEQWSERERERGLLSELDKNSEINLFNIILQILVLDFIELPLFLVSASVEQY